MERNLFNLKFAAKEMARNANKCEKMEQVEREKCKRAIRKNTLEVARVHAENAIRQRQQALALLRMSSRLDSVAARLQTMISTRRLTQTIKGVTKSMDFAIKQMDISQLTMLMDRFDEQCEELDVANMVAESSMDQTASTTMPTRMVDDLMMQIAEENGLEIRLEMPQVALDSLGSSLAQDQDELAKRLSQLRK